MNSASHGRPAGEAFHQNTVGILPWSCATPGSAHSLKKKKGDVKGQGLKSRQSETSAAPLLEIREKAKVWEMGSCQGTYSPSRQESNNSHGGTKGGPLGRDAVGCCWLSGFQSVCPQAQASLSAQWVTPARGTESTGRLNQKQEKRRGGCSCLCQPGSPANALSGFQPPELLGRAAQW